LAGHAFVYHFQDLILGQSTPALSNPSFMHPPLTFVQI
jgi:hypothetical protein